MLTNAKESTRRAMRTVLQGASAFAAFLVAVAIPPIGDAINAVLQLVPGVNVTITPGIVASIGLVGTALIALVSKIQNLVEGRDEIESPTELAVEVIQLAGLVEALVAEAKKAGVEVDALLDEHGVTIVNE